MCAIPLRVFAVPDSCRWVKVPVHRARASVRRAGASLQRTCAPLRRTCASAWGPAPPFGGFGSLSGGSQPSACERAVVQALATTICFVPPPCYQSRGFGGPGGVTTPLFSLRVSWRSLLLYHAVSALVRSPFMFCCVALGGHARQPRSCVDPGTRTAPSLTCVGATLSTQPSLSTYLPTMCSWCRQLQGLGPPAGRVRTCWAHGSVCLFLIGVSTRPGSG